MQSPSRQQYWHPCSFAYSGFRCATVFSSDCSAYKVHQETSVGLTRRLLDSFPVYYAHCSAFLCFYKLWLGTDDIQIVACLPCYRIIHLSWQHRIRASRVVKYNMPLNCDHQSFPNVHEDHGYTLVNCDASQVCDLDDLTIENCDWEDVRFICCTLKHKGFFRTKLKNVCFFNVDFTKVPFRPSGLKSEVHALKTENHELKLEDQYWSNLNISDTIIDQHCLEFVGNSDSTRNIPFDLPRFNERWRRSRYGNRAMAPILQPHFDLIQPTIWSVSYTHLTLPTKRIV